MALERLDNWDLVFADGSRLTMPEFVEELLPSGDSVGIKVGFIGADGLRRGVRLLYGTSRERIEQHLLYLTYKHYPPTVAAKG